MKTFKLQVPTAYAEIINLSIARRIEVCGPIKCLAPGWYKWCDKEEILECELNIEQVNLISESLYIWGPESISTRSIMDRIIFKLASIALS